MVNFYTTKQLSDMFKVSSRRVTRMAKSWGLGRKDSDRWVFCDQDIEIIKKKRGWKDE